MRPLYPCRSPSPKISEKSDPKCASVAWVAFFDIFAGDFCYRTARWLQHKWFESCVRRRILAFGFVPEGRIVAVWDIVRLLLTQVVVCIWIVLLC